MSAAIAIFRADLRFAMSFRLLLLKDWRPGHFHKTDGVAKALARHLALEIDQIAVRAPVLVPGRVQRMLCNLRLPPASVLRLVWNIRAARHPHPDLIVSAGADTLVPNLLLARHFGCRNVFIGSLRGLPPQGFSAVLHTHPDLAGAERHIILLAPSTVDPDRLSPPRAFGAAEDFAGLRATLLLGGPTPGYAFGRADWDGAEALLRETARRGLSWVVASSRRTPATVADRFAALAASLPRSIRFLDYRTQAAGAIDPLFEADALLVTEDSNTMLAEAVASRRPVVALRPEQAPPTDPSLVPLVEEGRIALVRMAEATPQQLVEAIHATRALDLNPLDLLYERLAAAGIVPADG